jgi:hypothetical protein
MTWRVGVWYLPCVAPIARGAPPLRDGGVMVSCSPCRCAALIAGLSLAASFWVPERIAAQSAAPGGFVESATSTAVRSLLTAAQLQALLPARGPFTFPAPYNTQGARLTNAADCGGGDCLHPVGYSYWRNINNHAGSDTMYVFLTLSRSNGGGGPTLFTYDKSTRAVTNAGPLFDASAGLSWATGEGWYFSATRPHALYLNDGPALKRYDILTRQIETVFDVSQHQSVFGSNRIVWQLHSSSDDRVHSATIKDGGSYAELGCMAYREDTRQVFYFPRLGAYDECQIDKSGRWLVIKENVDGQAGEDNRIIDLATGAETRLLDQNGAGGHSDNGHGYLVAADNWDTRPNAIKVWKFGQSPLQGTLVYHNLDWNVGAPNHVSHANASSAVAAEQQYACGSSANRMNSARANEVICFPLDGSLRTLVVAPVMTDLNAPGGGDDYSKLPKGNLDLTGEYFVWTANLGGNRLDAFIVRVPGHLLIGSTPPADTEPPAVSLQSPANGSLIAGSVTVSASATDNASVAGVQFRLDGSNLGAEDTTAPYAIAWTPSPATNGTRQLSAVARDAAGNTAASAAITVTVDTVPPAISSVLASAISESGATIAWLTNEPADSQIEYGVTTTYGASTALNVSLVNAHSTAVNGLTAGTTYHYRVRSRDAAGHFAASGDFVLTTAPPPPPPPPPPPVSGGGLVAHWRFDEASGTTAADASGNGYTGALINGPAWTHGMLGRALAFDGANDRVQVPHAGPLNAFPLTVSAWIRTSTAKGVVGIVNKYVASSYDGYNLFMNGGALCAWYLRSASNHAYDGGGCTLRTIGYNDNRWHHVAYVVDQSSARLYVDGLLKGTQRWTGTAGPPATTRALQIGRYPGGFGGNEYFPGSIDDVRIYNRALASSDIALLATPSLTTADLAGYWMLDEGGGVVAGDGSGNDQTGAVLNGAAWGAGRVGGGVVLDGVDDHVAIGHSAGQNAFPLSVAVWFRTTSTSGVRGLVNKYVAGSYHGYNLFVNDGALCAWFLRGERDYVYDGSGCTHRATGYNDGQWHHAVYVVDPAGGTLYVDGVEQSRVPWTGAAGATTNMDALLLGRYPGAYGGAEFLDGAIDDVRIYARALTAAEAAALSR